ncbi:MAG: hypothetical protein KJ077_33700 [Anaerolineae bacterium]|nr:hypothetical protein [Anaerolineae bacterium]
MTTAAAKSLGYLIIYRMADIAAPYAALEALAQQTGFDAAYVPRPPRPHDAWEKATNLKKQKLQPPQDFVSKIKAQYGCEPLVWAETKIVSNDEQYGACRHLVRSVVVKAAGEKDKQLDMKSVAILKFDADALSLNDKFIGLYHPDFDPLSATNGNIKILINRMQDEYERQLVMADGQDVRNQLRRYLDGQLRAKCLADGTYFVRDNVPGAADKLEALQTFILSLGQYKTTDNVLTCQVYQVADDGSAFAARNRAEITAGVIDQFKKELAGLLREFSEPDGRGPQATEKRVKEAGARFLELKQDLKLFQESLGDELQALSDYVQMCQGAMLKAADQ